MMKDDHYWPPWTIRAAWAIVALGMLLRVPLYLANRSLWGDEASVAVNLIHRSYGQLCRPLDYEQGAPIGYLFAQKTAVLLLGDSEFALRLLPLLCGIAVLVLAYLIVRRCFNPFAGLATLAMLAVSKNLITFSAELKQYSSDVMLCLLIVLCAIKVIEAIQKPGPVRRPLLWFAVVCVIAVWFSHPAVFVVAGVSSVLLIEAWRTGRRDLALPTGAAALAGGASAVCHYLLFAAPLAHDNYLITFWQHGMMPLDSPHAALQWLGLTIRKSMEIPLGATAVWPLMLFLAIGIVGAIRGRHRALVGMLIACVLFTLAASALHKYPFSERLILFLSPLLIFAAAAGLAEMWRLPAWGRWVAPVLLVGILIEPTLFDVKDALKRELREETRPLLVYLRAQQRPGDAIYVAYRGRPAFEYYTWRHPLAPLEIHLGTDCDSQASLLRQLAPLAGEPRVWVWRTTSNPDCEQDILAVLPTVGARLPGQAQGRMAKLELYNFAANRSAAVGSVPEFSSRQ